MIVRNCCTYFRAIGQQSSILVPSDFHSAPGSHKDHPAR